MTIIGLTGGIAAGKSTAAEMLREFGATVIDADRLGHRSYEPGTPGFQKVVNAFGHDIVAKDGTIDRRVLGGKVFGAPGQLERLNAIVWPEIRALIKEEIKQIRSQEQDPVIVLEAAVLLEAEWQDLCDEVWVVLTPVKTAVERLRERNNLAPDAAMARINAQMSNKERAALADVKIENASDEEALRQRVERAWKALVTRRGKRPGATKATKTGSVKASNNATPAKAVVASKTTTKAATSKAAAKAAPTTAAKAKPAAKPAAAAAKKAPAKSVARAAAKAAPKTTTRAAASKPAASKAAPAKAAATKPAASKAAPTKAATTKAAAKPAAKAATKAAPKAAAKAAPKKGAAPKAAKPAAKPASKAAGARSK